MYFILLQITITRKTVLLKKQGEGLRNGKIDMKLLKLTSLIKQELEDKRKEMIKGGEPPKICSCYCACKYEDEGGSSTASNKSANNKDGLSSPRPPLE